MHPRTQLLFGLVLLSAASCATTPAQPLLPRIGAELAELRSLRPETRTQAACPDGIESLIGYSRSDVIAALGEPDFVSRSPDVAFATAKITYFFKSPDAPYTPTSRDGIVTAEDLQHFSVGGGFPELSFSFGTDNLVVQCKCSYAR